VTVYVDDNGTLDVTITGAGVVRYRGNPTVTSNITGGGRLEQIP
jgi:hypothetical protein